MTIKELCQKYRDLILNGEVVDQDEMVQEFEGVELKDVCPEMAEYLAMLGEK